MKHLAVGLVMLVVVGVGALRWYDHATVGGPVAKALSLDPRGSGYTLRANRQYRLPLGTLVLDFREADPEFRGDAVSAFLRASVALFEEGRSFGRVMLSRRGEPRFLLDGSAFWEFGARHESVDSPSLLLASLPSKLRRPDGSAPYRSWSGTGRLQERRGLVDLNDAMLEWMGR